VNQHSFILAISIAPLQVHYYHAEAQHATVALSIQVQVPIPYFLQGPFLAY